MIGPEKIAESRVLFKVLLMNVIPNLITKSAGTKLISDTRFDSRIIWLLRDLL